MNMELSKGVSKARIAITVALTAVAIRSLWEGKRVRGALAGAVAVALGYRATTEVAGPKAASGIDTTSEDGELRCAICGEPIRPGQSRGPNENDEIVHEACEESSA